MILSWIDIQVVLSTSRQQFLLSLNDYWHSRRSPHIPCHGEVTQRFSVLSPPSALWESDQKQFYDQELLTLTSCQESERRGSKWSAAHIPTHVHQETHINHTQTLAHVFWDLVLDAFTPTDLLPLSIMVFVFSRSVTMHVLRRIMFVERWKMWQTSLFSEYNKRVNDSASSSFQPAVNAPLDCVTAAYK